jgi:uncharacterized protein (TIGR02996 family)
MAEEESLIRAIQMSPSERLNRLVYADWLDERSDPRGEYLRLDDMLLNLLSVPDPPPWQSRVVELRSTNSPEWLASIGSHRVSSADKPEEASFQRRERIAARLGRPVTFTDSKGYEQEIVAAAEHPATDSVAYVECRSKWIGNTQDIKYHLKLRRLDSETVAWDVETYNPYFGCNVRFLEWYGDTVLIIYREKHRTYAARVGLDYRIEYKELSDDWILEGPQIAFRKWQDPIIRRLRIPELEPLPELTEQQALAWNICPPKTW